MDDEQIAARMRSGSTLTTFGVMLIIVTVLGTCVVAMGNADDADPAARGFQTGQSPILLIAIGASIALIAVGQARKSNARRALEERVRQSNTTVELVPDPAVPGGPFRGGHKEVEKLDPDFAAAETAERDREHSRGNGYLIAGGIVLVVTVVGMLLAMRGDSDQSARKQLESIFVALGLAFFPFGLGLFLAIKGLLLRSK